MGKVTGAGGYWQLRIDTPGRGVSRRRDPALWPPGMIWRTVRRGPPLWEGWGMFRDKAPLLTTEGTVPGEIGIRATHATSVEESRSTISVCGCWWPPPPVNVTKTFAPRPPLCRSHRKRYSSFEFLRIAPDPFQLVKAGGRRQPTLRICLGQREGGLKSAPQSTLAPPPTDPLRRV